MKKYLIGFLCGALVFSAGTAFGASKTVQATYKSLSIFVNGKKVTVDKQPVSINGTDYVPLDSLSKLLGYKVEKDTKKSLVYISNNGKSYLKTPDKKTDSKQTIFESCPLVIRVGKYDSRIEINSIGTPELIVKAYNSGKKKIVAFEFVTKFLDAFDDPVYKIGTKSPLFYGVVQDADLNVIPDGDPSKISMSDYEREYRFNLVLYDGAYKIDELSKYDKNGLMIPLDREIQVTRIKFSDGTEWKHEYVETFTTGQ